LLRVSRHDLWPGREHVPNARLLASMYRVAQVGMLLAFQAEVLQLEHALSADRHQRQTERPVGRHLIDLVEGRNPVLPVAVGHELACGSLEAVRWADRIAQSERRTTSQRERDAGLAVDAVVARRSVDG